MANRPVQNSSTMKFLNIKISQDEIDPLERKTLPMSSNSETWSTTPTFDSTSTSSGRLSISPARPVGPPSQVLPKRIREIPGAFQYQNQFDCVNPPNQSYREVHLVDIPTNTAPPVPPATVRMWPLRNIDRRFSSPPDLRQLQMDEQFQNQIHGTQVVLIQNQISRLESTVARQWKATTCVILVLILTLYGLTIIGLTKNRN